MGNPEPVSASTRNKRADSKSKPAGNGTFPIVGIGSSAGGLEACQALLKALPADLGMAFIFVPHLDPSRQSAFSEILTRSTTMPVNDVADGTRVTPNHIFVIHLL